MAVRRKRKRRARSKRKSFGFAAAPKRHRRRRRRSNIFAANPRHRRRASRRRHYRHNPPSVRNLMGELGWGAAGFMATKVVGNFVTPMVSGFVGDQPVMKIGVKLGVAYLAAWGLSSFMGQRVFVPAMLGGSMDAIQEAVKTFIAPSFPMLADYGAMESYYEPTRLLPPGMGEYMGDGLSQEHDVIV